MMSPLLYPALLADKPKFSGLKGDWFTFAKEWEGYVDTIKATQVGLELSDHLRLELLKGSLDETNKKWLQGKREGNPRLTFEEVWDWLGREFGGDWTKKTRDLWQGVRINQEPP